MPGLCRPPSPLSTAIVVFEDQFHIRNSIFCCTHGRLHDLLGYIYIAVGICSHSCKCICKIYVLLPGINLRKYVAQDRSQERMMWP